MSDELNKYPGNLKHHKVDGGIDEDTALLISNLAAEVVRLRDARAKDAELIQRMVDGWYTADGGSNMRKAVEDAIAAGYIPTQAE